jgi:hypothetical protein
MVQIRCTLCSKSWSVAYFGNVRKEQIEHDQAAHPEVVRKQEALFEEARTLMVNGDPSGQGVAGRCSFCGRDVEDQREHEMAEHPAEHARATALADSIRELDRHWEMERR